MFAEMNLVEIIQMLLPFIVLEFGLKIYCLVQLSKHEVKYMPKWGWALVILIINIFGSAAYLLFGKERGY